MRGPVVVGGAPGPATAAAGGSGTEPLGRPGLAVEVATWPPVEVVDVDGWRVGLSAGFTRRGNSVAALAAPADVAAALDRVEALYAAHGLPPVVRVCADSRPGDLDEHLASRGYAVAATTVVMAAPLPLAAGGASAPAGTGEPADPGAGGPGTSDPGTSVPGTGDPGTSGPGAAATAVAGARLVVTDAPDEAWLRGWLDVKASSPVDLDLAARLVGGAPARYARLVDEAGTLGVVRTATTHGWAALSCLMVHPRGRRRGLGRALTHEALAAAHARGARRAYLQVEQANAGAVALYAGLGFVPVDRYHYRERRSTS